MDHLEEKSAFHEQSKEKELAEVDLATFHEREAGRLILDPAEARIEFGERFAARLKLTEDGKTILWPQPTDDPADPQNWSSRKKAVHLFIMSLATIVPDFESAIGIASVFELAETYNTTTEEINNVSSNWTVFLVEAGAVSSVLPILKQPQVFLLDSDASKEIWTTPGLVLVTSIGTGISHRSYPCSDIERIRGDALPHGVLWNVSSNRRTLPQLSLANPKLK
ncbi:hypothetical protein VNI00_013550 [Paramarasmius palmivorus]|uniref:Uncharacterized protein n=1 Tax=Paramarasmius palmivorus TaxID=297713 RepID=A0AAW0BWE1_9AGAR